MAKTRLVSPPLARTMKLMGALLLTLSAATPASSVFVIVPDVVSQAGTGALLSMLAAAAIAICVAQVYAELSSAFPIAGGEYAMVGRVLGPLAGLVVLALNLTNSLLATAVLALGVSGYLTAWLPDLGAAPTALVVVGGATALSVLNIRTNALVTGVFMGVELAALLGLAALGWLHPARGLAPLLFHPQVMLNGALHPASVSLIALAVALAIFAYDGYGSAVYFAEELRSPAKTVGRAILWALVIIVGAEVIPLAAVLTGAPDLKSLLVSKAVFVDFAREAGGPVVAQVLGLGVALAILNAVIAMILLSARQLYATGRDAIWPGPVSRALTTLHPQFSSPWIATLLGGTAAGALCWVDLKLLLIATGTGVAVIYALLCVTLIVGRRTGATRAATQKSPFAPIVAALAFVALLGVLYADWLDPAEGRPGLWATGATALLGALVYIVGVRQNPEFALRAPQDLEVGP